MLMMIEQGGAAALPIPRAETADEWREALSGRNSVAGRCKCQYFVFSPPEPNWPNESMFHVGKTLRSRALSW